LTVALQYNDFVTFVSMPPRLLVHYPKYIFDGRLMFYLFDKMVHFKELDAMEEASSIDSLKQM